MNTQPIEKSSKAETLDVHSVFDTIQGEGPFAGRPAVFVRLAGCNLQCPLCDTDYTSERTALTTHQTALVVHNLRPAPWLVVITGGEPFRQAALVDLVDRLLYNGYAVQIETNGTLWLDFPMTILINMDFTIVCSPKTGKVHPKIQEYVGAWKYVLKADDELKDGLPSRALDHTAHPFLARPQYNVKTVPIFLQPADEKDEFKNLLNQNAVVASAMRKGYTVCLQTHKLLGVE